MNSSGASRALAHAPSAAAPGTPAARGRTQPWEDYLSSRLGCTTRVQFGRSRTLPIQILRDRAQPARLCLRLHLMFEVAPPEVYDAVARWIKLGRRAKEACSLLDRWIEKELLQLPARRPPRARLCAQGKTHDLCHLAQSLWEEHFGADFQAEPGRPALSWGRPGSRRTRFSLRLGSYALDQHLVRLHPVLDQPAVPNWFVRFVLYHEILHAALPPKRNALNRWVHHSPAFRGRERAYPDYARAMDWEARHLHALIQSARTGSPLSEHTARRTRLSQRLLF